MSYVLGDLRKRVNTITNSKYYERRLIDSFASRKKLISLSCVRRRTSWRRPRYYSSPNSSPGPLLKTPKKSFLNRDSNLGPRYMANKPNKMQNFGAKPSPGAREVVSLSSQRNFAEPRQGGIFCVSRSLWLRRHSYLYNRSMDTIAAVEHCPKPLDQHLIVSEGCFCLLYTHNS